MGWQIAFYIFYGLISGLAEILPASSAAQAYLLTELTAIETRHPLTLLLMHTASVTVLLIQCRHRIGHMRREMQLETQDPRRRKRQPDRMTVLDTKIVLICAVPAAVMLAFSDYVYRGWTNTITLAISLVIGGILIYMPQFRPGANRDSRHLSPMEAMKMGFWAGLGVFPGFSRMGLFVSDGLKRGCDKRYLLDIAFLLTIPALLMLVILDAVSLLTLGVQNVDSSIVLFSLLASAAAFGGAWLGTVIMRFVSVNAGYSAFAYYSWGLGLFSFILYLMV